MKGDQRCNNCSKFARYGRCGYDLFNGWYCNTCWKEWDKEENQDTNGFSSGGSAPSGLIQECSTCGQLRGSCKPGKDSYKDKWFCKECWESWRKEQKSEVTSIEDARRAAEEAEKKLRHDAAQAELEKKIKLVEEKRQRQRDEQRKQAKLEHDAKTLQLEKMQQRREEGEAKHLADLAEKKRILNDAWEQQLKSEQSFETGHIIEPTEGHDSTVILLNGYAAEAVHWKPYRWALEQTETAWNRLRWVALNPPRRPENRSERSAGALPKDLVHSWFDYIGNGSSRDKRSLDSIDTSQLATMRTGLHDLLRQEVAILKANSNADATGRIILVGFSQGAAMALDASLTVSDPDIQEMIAGVLMIRAAALCATTPECQPRTCGPVPVLAVCGSKDSYYPPSTVESQLHKLPSSCVLPKVQVVEHLDHHAWFDFRELEAVVTFIVESLHLIAAETYDASTIREKLKPWACPWYELSARERIAATSLNVKDSHGWDRRESPLWSKHWGALSLKERPLLESLGITSELWNVIQTGRK